MEAHDVPDELQLELIDLQCDNALKDKFSSVSGIQEFYQYLGPEYTKLRTFSSRILSMFGTTYVCEQLFLTMNLNKSRLRSALTNTNSNCILKVASAQSLSPDVDPLVKGKRAQVSKNTKEQH